MTHIGCFLWWLLLGTLLGWLASWLFGRRAPVTIEKIIDRPVEKIVEKIIDRPVDRIVEKFVDNPAHLTRIGALEAEVAMIAGLRSTISQLQSAPPKIVEKIVDRPVEKIIEKIVDRPVDRIVEKLVDNPVHLSRIKTLEAEVAMIAGLRSTISQLQSAPPKIVEKIVDRPVDKIVEKLVDNPAQTARFLALEKELESLRKKSVTLDRAAATASGFKVRGMDDLEVIEGIGPKIAELFHAEGIHMFWELAETPQARMQQILDKAGANYKLANPSTWARQADLAAKNRWAELRKLQDELDSGVEK